MLKEDKEIITGFFTEIIEIIHILRDSIMLSNNKIIELEKRIEEIEKSIKAKKLLKDRKST